MHQDVFIMNVNFMADIIKSFRENPDYGMLGVCGADRVFEDANYWVRWNAGSSRWGSNMEEKAVYNRPESLERLIPVVAIDGMMIVTQVDLPWREDLFDAFDFYDVSQSFEFQKAGYKVGVVPQLDIWCHHDCAWSNMSRYDLYRRIFCREYSEYGYKYEEIEININQRETQEELDRHNAEFGVLLERGRSGDKGALSAMLNVIDKYKVMNRTLATYVVILEAIYREWLDGANEFLEGGRVHSVEEMTNRFTRYKYFLRRVELGFPLEDDEVFAEIAARADKRLIDLRSLAPHVTLEPEATIKRLEKEL
jgi:hypothetical protein